VVNQLQLILNCITVAHSTLYVKSFNNENIGDLLVCCISMITLFLCKVSFLCIEFVLEYVYTSFFATVSLYLAVFSFPDIVLLGLRKLGDLYLEGRWFELTYSNLHFL
jgi:undecaprenyl pyrophosphate phosphatase UppP